MRQAQQAAVAAIVLFAILFAAAQDHRIVVLDPTRLARRGA